MMQKAIQFGFFGEDVITDLFTLDSYRFHIYDKDKKEYAHTDEKILSWLYENEIKDEKGEVCFKIGKNLTFISDEYTVTKKKNSSVTMDKAIFLTCIIDAIMDANSY